MSLTESLHALAEQNHHGIAFLLAYGTTWLACGGLWRILNPKIAALVTLMQGMVAASAALTLSYATGALGQERPVEDAITELSIYIGGSQFLGLPFLILLHVRGAFTLVPVAFAAKCAMHFVLYSWLYQTPIYVVMSAAIALGGMIVMTAWRDEVRAASAVCFFTSGAMLVTSGAFVLA